MNSSNNTRQQLPVASSGRVTLSLAGILSAKGKFWIYDCKFNISGITSAYLVIDEQSDRFLFLQTRESMNYISLDYENFQRVYNQLSKKFGFDDILFQKYRNAGKPLKVRIWQKIVPVNYRILKDSFTDIEEGFEIQSPDKEFISWNMPLFELRKSKNIRAKSSFFDSKHIGLKYPVRVGNILLDNWFSILNQVRADAPALHFFTQCYDQTNTDKSYWELKKNLEKMGDVESTGGYERDDQNHFSVNIKGVLLELTYSHDSKDNFDSGSTSFCMYNYREYEHLLVDQAYEAEIEVSDYVKLEGNLQIIGDYKKEKTIRRRPPRLIQLCGKEPVVWIDRKNLKIGFADQRYAVIYETKDLKHMAILNILPARGSGFSELKLALRKERYFKTIFTAGCYSFDDYAESLRQLTRKSVHFLPENMDV